MKMILFISLFTLSLTSSAQEQFRYLSKWTVLYAFNGSNRVTKLPHKADFQPKGQDCKIGQEESPKENVFQRSIVCPKKTITIKCVGKPRTWEEEMIVKCEDKQGAGKKEIVLIGEVESHFTKRYLRKRQAEEELKNRTSY